MKLPFGKKEKATDPAGPGPKAVGKASMPIRPSAKIPDGKKQIITGLIFISASFIGAVFLLYLTVNAQSAKEVEFQDLNQKLHLVSTEKEAANNKAETLQSKVGRVLDLEKVVRASEKIHDESEATRKEGSLWIDRKTSRCMVTLGVLNGVHKGSRLNVYEADNNKVGVVKVTSALDVVSYVEPVDKKVADFTRDYYHVKSE